MADITDVRLVSGFVYLAVVRNVYNRMVRGWKLGDSPEGSLTLTALNRALRQEQVEKNTNNLMPKFGSDHANSSIGDRQIVKIIGISIQESQKASVRTEWTL